MSPNVLAFLLALVFSGPTPSAALAQAGQASCAPSRCATPMGRATSSTASRPDCPAPDDAEHQLGDPQEGSLEEALTFAATGACSAPAAATLRTARIQRRGPRVLGWQSLVNAY